MGSSLHVDVNVRGYLVGDLVDALRSAFMGAPGHANVELMGAAEVEDLFCVGGYDDFTHIAAGANAFVHAGDQWFAGNLTEHLPGKAGRSQARRDYGDCFHVDG
jgi:hypothetical protein